MTLPDQASFIIENTRFEGNVELESNHHCNVGVTGALCMPVYILHNISWKVTKSKWVHFHNDANNKGGIFTLSPSEGNNMDGIFFPPGFVSLSSEFYTYLLDIQDGGSAVCYSTTTLNNIPGVSAATLSSRFSNGILCKRPLRALKIWTKNLSPATASKLQIEIEF